MGILTGGGLSEGSVQDISVSGARIEGTTVRPAEGSMVRLGFSFYAEALPVPMRAQVVRHTETGGFAVRFDDVDFRTQILLRALLPQVGSDGASGPDSGSVEELRPELLHACTQLAKAEGMSLKEWVHQQLERAADEGGPA